MEQTFYARSSSAAGERETVKHHLNRVSELCANFLSPLGIEDVGSVLGTFHDFGKYSIVFQEVLAGRRFHVNHAFPGAALAYNTYQKKGRTAALIATAIAAHHSELDYGCIDVLKRLLTEEGHPQDADDNAVSMPNIAAMRNAIPIFRAENSLPRLSSSLMEDDCLAKMLCTRFLLSALADADYSASAEHFDPDYISSHTGKPFLPGEALERLCAVRAEIQRSASPSALNTLRDELFEDCIHAASQAPGLFTLTAPTGLGKTISLFAFAAKHCEEHKKRRVIFILPYLAIAEQNVGVYRRAEPDLLESHSAALLDENSRILSERWSAPCIVTTNVGFFEPLFSARPTDCRRLHAIADSVIVLDEAQSLPPRLLQATLNTVNLLCEKYRCTFVFSTATQPSFQHLKDLRWTPREIVPEPKKLFNATRRVEYDWRIHDKTPFADICGELSAEKQVCVILNLRRHAKKVFDLLQAAGNVYFLSSDLCHAHRSAVLDEVQKRLHTGLPVRLVATQCIEAGVDLDFPVMYRALAPLEAIIQAAGRCNRNGHGPDGRVVVFVPDEERLYPGDSSDRYYESAAAQVSVLAARHPIDCSDLSHIEEYYSLVYRNAVGDKQSLKAAVEREDFAGVAEAYKLIPYRGAQVIVPYEGARELFATIRDKADHEGLTTSLMRMAGPITVSSFQKDIRNYALPLYHRSREHEDGGLTGWYLLGDDRFYRRDIGLFLGGNTDGII